MDSWWTQLKKFFWYLISGKDVESERKKEELKGVLKAIKEEEKKPQ